MGIRPGLCFSLPKLELRNSGFSEFAGKSPKLLGNIPLQAAASGPFFLLVRAEGGVTLQHAPLNSHTGSTALPSSQKMPLCGVSVSPNPGGPVEEQKWQLSVPFAKQAFQQQPT